MSRVLPILFNTDMVQAILDGRKTVTRRVIKQEKILNALSSPARKGNPDIPDVKFISCLIDAPYEPGDILYVRETWQVFQKYQSVYGFDVMYRADQKIRPCIFTFERYVKFVKYEDSKNYPRWISSQFAPKEAARIWLKVTDVRVEQLKDITEEQAKAEGAVDNRGLIHSPDNEYDRIHSAKDHFTQIWDSTIKKSALPIYGWDANPWVWTISFERCGKPDQTINGGD